MAQGAIQIDEAKLATVMEWGLSSGDHHSFEDGVCAMEAVAYITGEPHSDHPACVCPVITAFMISWNDSLSDEDRNRLILPLIVKTVGTRSTPEVEERRAIMAADWLIRVHTPAWLRLAGLKDQADTLANLPEITGVEGFAPIKAPLEAIRKDAAAARDAAWDAARAAAGDAAGAAAGAALKPTVAALQASASDLIERMCAVEA